MYAWVVCYGEVVWGICGVQCSGCGCVGGLGYGYLVGIGVKGPGDLSVWLYGVGYVALWGEARREMWVMGCEMRYQWDF